MGDMDAYKQEEGDRPVEHSPRGRYIRFDIRLGSGAYKTVYKAYDTDQGIDVAWNAIDIGVLPSSEKTRIIQEVQLLQKLEHKNIINFYGSWFSKEKNQVVFITEIMTSGTLKSYIKRVQFVKWKIIKRWCVQILEGLHYLHSQNPPVVHRDLKCDNIFINGNTGDLRIGDLGLSTQLAVHKRSKAQSVLGTPEFMAPELYDESYDEKVDIYAFGMCVLEMVTKEVPYSECINPAQIYKKVTAGIRPRGMQRIISQGARDFIELCLSRGNGQIDVSAQYLLNHDFLKPQDDDNELVQVLDEDALERDVPPPPPVPVMNARAFADQLDMESGSKGKDQTVPVTERRKHNASLSMEPEELSTGSAETSASSSGVQAADPVAEDKSPGKHRVLVPPKTLAASDVAPSAPSALPPLPPLPPRAPASASVVEPVVDEPLSDKKGDQDHVDTFLSGLPPSEANIRNHRIALMGGRGQRIETPDTSYGDDSGDDKHEAPATPAVAPVPAPASPVAVAAPPVPTPPSNDSGVPPDQAPVPVAPATERVASPTLSEPPPVVEAPVERRVRTNTIDSTGRATRPASAQRRRGKRYDIKASKDPDNSHGILLNLRIALDGRSKEIKFPFSLFTDSPHEVACELAVDVGILEPDLEDIAEAISFLVTEGKINNYSNADQDIWDEAPEPHGFPSKPLPPVSKMTFSSVPGAQALAGFPEGLQPVASGILPASQLDPSALRMSDSGLPSSISTTFATTIPTPHLTHSTSDSTLFTSDELPPSSPSYEHGISMGSMNDANFIRSVRKFEDRMMMARTAFDEREASLEEAIRTEEEKHQRELERIRKKMQQFNEKTARATMARQERMRLGTDEFRSDGETDGTGLDLDV